jgi:hypothetical protein
METVEPTIAKLAAESNRCRNPLEKADVIEFANSFIKGRVSQQEQIGIDWYCKYIYQADQLLLHFPPVGTIVL